MSSSWIKFIFILFCAAYQSFGQNSYSKIYNREFQETIQFYYSHKKYFEKSAYKIKLSPPFLFSIVAPEISQYSSIYNEAELYSLKVMYSQYGKDYSNFSIGYFQMKPSFIESLEEFIMENPKELKKFNYILIEGPQSKNSRIKRLERLSSLKWQFKYLSAFCAIVQLRFKNESFESNEDKLKFYATAYNSGFNQSLYHLKKMQQKKFFPRISLNKFNYADVSYLFYQNINK